MKAKHKILYREGIADINPVYGYVVGKPSNEILVELSEWKSDLGYEIILRTWVRLDGKEWEEVSIFEEKEKKSYYIRQAIKKFDSLFASHPKLGKEE